MSSSAALYLTTARRTVRRYGVRPWAALGRPDDQPVFVVGSPRSGTSFTAAAIGRVPGFADLGEVRALKAAIPGIFGLPVGDGAVRARSILRTAQRVGCVTDKHAVEQTPESTHVIPALARAFPRARFVHLVRDGRDVACSLIDKGWLSTGVETSDDAGQPFGDHARFWVEPERAAEFPTASEATRAAWVWRRYETVARRNLAELGERTIDIRYEEMAHHPDVVATALAAFLGAEAAASDFVEAFGAAFATSVGRYRRDLSPEQLADVVAEAGDLLAELGY